MNRMALFMVKVYQFLLRLYPSSYRAEYSEERLAVFALAAEEAAQQGKILLVKLGLHELWDFPGALLREHWREARKGKMLTKFNMMITFEPGSRREILAALAPFVMLGIFPSLFSLLRAPALLLLPAWLEGIMAIGLLGLMISLVVIGIIKGIPRWFFPYLGVVLSLVSVYALAMPLLPRFYIVVVDQNYPWFLGQVVNQGFLWMGLVLLIFSVVILTRVIPPLRPFYDRVRQDWTLLSFCLYGASLFVLLITFDDYPNEEPYLITSVLFLTVGGWFYLRNVHPWRRVLALSAGLTLAMWMAALGKAIIYSNPDWPEPLYTEFTWKTEAVSTMIMWGWLLLIMITPKLLDCTSHFKKQIQPQ